MVTKKNVKTILQLNCTWSEISDFGPRERGLCSRFSTVVRCPRKEIEISDQNPKWFILFLGYHHINFSFPQYKFLVLDVIIVFEIN